jgi:hypothetical protein
MIVAATFKTIDHFIADIKREGGGLFEDKAAGCDFADGWVHGLMHASGSVDSNPIGACKSASSTGMSDSVESTQIG